jgi:hypothetical protein
MGFYPVAMELQWDTTQKLPKWKLGPSIAETSHFNYRFLLIIK